MPTSTYGVRYPAATDPADVATDLNELATDVDGILNTIPVMTTKGDLVTRTATAPERLGVGADGTYLLADSTQSTGLRWGAPTFAADPYVMIAEDAKTTSASTSFSFSSIPSTYTDLFLRVSAAFVNASTALVPVILACNGTDIVMTQCVVSPNNRSTIRATGSTSLLLGTGTSTTPASVVDFGYFEYRIGNYSLTSMFKPIYVDGSTVDSGNSGGIGIGGGTYKSTSAITSITVRHATGAAIIAKSTARLYGMKRFGQ